MNRKKKIYDKGKAIAIDTISVINLDNNHNTKVLDEALKNNKEMDSYLSIMADEEKINQILSTYDRPEKENEANRLIKTIENIKPKYTLKRIYWLSSTIAAAILLISFNIWENNYKKQENDSGNHQIVSSNINDTQFNKPLLINEEGEIVVLDDEIRAIKDAIIISETYIDYTKTNKVSDANNIKITKVKEISYRTIKIPSQYTYTIKLSDGSEVILNANSSIKFPSEFHNDERVVYLQGEAYFNIKKSENPFIVKLDSDVSVKVYGTQFNINTNICDNVETLLINGKVGVQIDKDEVILKPSQMISIDCNKKYKLLNVDINKYIGWKSGHFISDFNEMGRLMSEIAQWYGVEFKFSKDIDLQKKLVIHLEKYKNINDLIDVLERAYKMRFIRDGGNLYYVEQLK